MGLYSTKAKEEGAAIHWADETGVKKQCNYARSYAPRGKTPVKKRMSKKFSINMISSITNQGKVQFMIYSETMNADKPRLRNRNFRGQVDWVIP